MPIEVNTDSNNDIVIEVEAGQGNANVTVDSQSQIINAIGTTALYGPKGDKGDQGDPGENATIEIGTVATGEPGTSVIVENAGTDTNAVLNFTIPRGDTGEAGADGQDGQDGADGADGVGISSIEKTSSSGLVDTYTITYTNTNTDTFDVTNGADGQDGQDGTDGQDGYSPTATVSKSGTVSTITITDKNGTTTVQVLDGAGGVSDVQVDGVSVVTAGVAEIDLTGKQDVLTAGTDLEIANNTINFTNSSGYTDNIGTVTSVNSVSPDSSGDVVLSIPSDTNDLTNGAGFITGINGTDVTTALGYTPLNRNASNLTSAGKKVLDGQWVVSGNTITSGRNAQTSTDLTYNLTSYLPADGQSYEVLFSMMGFTAATANSFQYGLLTTDIITQTARIYAVKTTAATASTAAGSVVLPVGAGRTVTVIANSSNTGTFNLYALGYRRIGTNS